MIENLIFEVYLLILDFPAESLKAKKTGKKLFTLQCSFTQKTSLILRTSINSTL